MTTVTYSPPGPGQWETLLDHFPHPLTPEYQRILGQAFIEGYVAPCRDYGLPLRTFDLRFVHGHPYLRPVSLVGGDRPQPKLPALLARVMFRVVPGLRRAAARAEVAMTERRWLKEAAEWNDELRPVWIARNRALQSVDLTALADDELAERLEVLRVHALDGYRLHFTLHGADLLPAGVFLTRCRAWGIEPETALPLLTGHSPATRLEGVDAEDLRWRSATGYDLDAPTVGELAARGAFGSAGSAGLASRKAPAPVEPSADLVGRVPEAERDEFTQWLHDARTTYGVRDDNGGILGAWTIGLLRRAMLHAGARLGLHSEAHAVELTVRELRERLGGASTPTADEAASRADTRAALRSSPAPRTLGPDEPIPPVEALPHAMRAFTEAFLMFRELNSTAPPSGPRRGVGIGTTQVTGRAVVAHDPLDAMTRLEPGDILITTMTTPAFNAVLMIAGGLVVVEAGLVSHAAVIARELGLPTVLGVADAMTIDDGVTITLDPVAGTLQVA